MREADITSQIRGQMKVYAAREYEDDTYRTTNYVEVNIPEYLPTTPQDDSNTVLVVESNYFVNSNYPVTQDALEIAHSLSLPLKKGTIAPLCFHKGAEFLLTYPTGKIEEGYLEFLADKEES